MHALSARDLRRALAFLGGCADAAGDPASLVRHVVATLPRLVASELTTLSVCDRGLSHRGVHCHPAGALGPEDCACFDLHFARHPLVRWHFAHPRGTSRRLSDLWSGPRFRREPVYADYYRRIGVDCVVAVPLAIDDRLLVSVVLNRARHDFGARDFALLEAVRGPLAGLYRQTLAAAEGRDTVQRLLDAQERGRAACVIDAAGRAQRMPGAAVALLAQASPGWRWRPGAPLPPAVAGWIAARAGPSGSPLVLPLPGGTLQLQAQSGGLVDGGRLVFLELRATDRARGDRVAAAAPLTPREAEVLDWVAAAKTNREVAELLGMSPRTVAKHLERVFTKLGVGSRLAAVQRTAPSGPAGRTPG